MNLYIHSENNKVEPQKMPEHLSQFFEQYHGFGEASEVAQVEVLLDLEMSMFQKHTRDENKPEWIDIVSITALTNKFISAIHANPNFSKGIKHTGIPASDFRTEFLHAQKNKDDIKLLTLLKRWQNTPDSAFPPDTKYISDGKLLFDLVELEKILNFLWKMGVKKVALIYN